MFFFKNENSCCFFEMEIFKKGNETHKDIFLNKQVEQYIFCSLYVGATF